MAEKTNPGNSNSIRMEGTTRESGKSYQIGIIKTNQLFLGNESATPLLERIEKSGKAESVGILKAGDLPKSLAYWQGRVEEIEKLRQWFADKNVRLIGIEGIGGTGKSMLAAKIYEEIEGFPKLFWADVSSGAIIFSDLAQRVLTEFGCRVPEEESDLVNALVRCLRSGKYLLVIDNLESLLKTDRQWKSQFYEEFFRAWIESGKESKILVTTREKPDLREFEWLHLKGLKKDEGASLLRELGIQGELETFAELVDGHPLLLKIVADLIKDEYPQDPSLERLKDLGLGDLRELLTDSRVVGPHRRENVGMVLVLDASFERLADWQKIWLQNLSVYRSTFDWEAAMAVFPQTSDSDPLLVERREIEQELRKLLKRSLLEEKLNPKRQFSFQPVVLEYVRYKAGDQTEAHQQAIYYYLLNAKAKPWQTKDDLNEYLEIFHHLCQLEEYAEADEILSYCNEFLNLRGYYSTIVELNEQLVQNWKPKDNEEKEKFGRALMRLGGAYRALGQYQRAIDYHQKALEISREINDRQWKGSCLGNLGVPYHCLGQYHRAIDYYQQALEIAREIGNRSGEGICLGNLGLAYYSLGQYQRAIDYHQQALEIVREIGDRSGEGKDLGNLGLAYKALGQYQRAIDYHQQALEIAREIDDRQWEGGCLGNLGLAYNFLGHYQTAIGYYQQALEIAREIGDRSGEGKDLGNLGLAYNCLEQYQTAIDYVQQALEIAREIGDRQWEGGCLGNLGSVYHSLGEFPTAIDYHQQALEIAREIGDRPGEANAWFNLGDTLSELKQKSDAIDAYRNARQLYEAMGLDANVQDCDAAIERLSQQ
ncbi:MAG: tetratricopeptide repeat protein [Xenococcus sp. MO_188.B8]|nr:tetratricopeptide repeat protein [Xenococcus sp. MO_188.B8]